MAHLSPMTTTQNYPTRIKEREVAKKMTTIDLSNVSNGIYFLKTGENKETKKLIKR